MPNFEAIALRREVEPTWLAPGWLAAKMRVLRNNISCHQVLHISKHVTERMYTFTRLPTYHKTRNGFISFSLTAQLAGKFYPSSPLPLAFDYSDYCNTAFSLE